MMSAKDGVINGNKGLARSDVLVSDIKLGRMVRFSTRSLRAPSVPLVRALSYLRQVPTKRKDRDTNNEDG
jgi:hypothetical protein